MTAICMRVLSYSSVSDSQDDSNMYEGLELLHSVQTDKMTAICMRVLSYSTVSDRQDDSNMYEGLELLHSVRQSR